jgi:hypothetical protein
MIFLKIACSYFPKNSKNVEKNEKNLILINDILLSLFSYIIGEKEVLQSAINSQLLSEFKLYFRKIFSPLLEAFKDIISLTVNKCVSLVDKDLSETIVLCLFKILVKRMNVFSKIHSQNEIEATELFMESDLSLLENIWRLGQFNFFVVEDEIILLKDYFHVVDNYLFKNSNSEKILNLCSLILGWCVINYRKKVKIDIFGLSFSQSFAPILIRLHELRCEGNSDAEKLWSHLLPISSLKCESSTSINNKGVELKALNLKASSSSDIESFIVYVNPLSIIFNFAKTIKINKTSSRNEIYNFLYCLSIVAYWDYKILLKEKILNNILEVIEFRFFNLE